MSSGDSSSESVSAAGQPAGAGEKHEWAGQAAAAASPPAGGLDPKREKAEHRGPFSQWPSHGGGAQTQPWRGLLVLRSSVLCPLLIGHLVQAGLQLPHVLKQLLGQRKGWGRLCHVVRSFGRSP